MKKTAKQPKAVTAPALTTDPADIFYLFLVWGRTLAPRRVSMNSIRKDYFDQSCQIAETRLQNPEQARTEVYRKIFGKGAEFAVLCTKRSMAAFAAEYPKDAPHAQALKYLAACIALGRVPQSGQDSDGGQETPIDPVKPLPNLPGGSKVSSDLAPVGDRS